MVLIKVLEGVVDIDRATDILIDVEINLPWGMRNEDNRT
jgi:hypothetical protein